MATINDIGVAGQPLGTPPLTAWQAAVRDHLNTDVWTSWIPTPTGFTVSSTDCRYRRTPGGLVTIDAHFTVATVTANSSFTLPVPPARRSFGTCVLEDNTPSSVAHLGLAYFATGGPCTVQWIGTNGMRNVLTASTPFTWAAGDLIHVFAQYPAAPAP